MDVTSRLVIGVVNEWMVGVGISSSFRKIVLFSSRIRIDNVKLMSLVSVSQVGLIIRLRRIIIVDLIVLDKTMCIIY